MRKEGDFNYTDSFQTANQIKYQSDLQDKAIQLQGRKTYIFKLDKEKTNKSPIYNEAKNGRIYLPHFEQRALYNLNTWTNFTGEDNFVEKEETLEFEYNFARLVCNIRDLMDKVSGKLLIKNKSSEMVRLSIENGIFLVTTSKGVVVVNKELKNYKNINLLISEINKECCMLELSYKGNSESAESISNVKLRLEPNREKEIDVQSRLYQNCKEVITEGDIILTDKFKAYQVNAAYPADGMINEYIGWKCNCNLIDLALANLPDDFRKIINRNEYSMEKTRKE